jgi:hypothetical protein
VKQCPIQKKGGILRRLFGKRIRVNTFGGESYLCPEEHELISVMTWIS